jgi:hypothetical protein
MSESKSPTHRIGLIGFCSDENSSFREARQRHPDP